MLVRQMEEKLAKREEIFKEKMVAAEDRIAELKQQLEQATIAHQRAMHLLEKNDHYRPTKEQGVQV